MLPIRPFLLLSCAALAIGGTAFAQDDEADDATEKVEEIVEERAAEEASDGEPADADLGEASYNVADCSPGTDEDADASGDAEAEDDEDEEDTDAEGEEAIEDCEPVVK